MRQLIAVFGACLIMAGCMEGPAGPAGPEGERGPQGTQGAQGPAGAPGDDATGASVYVTTGFLTSSTKTTAGDFWDITNIFTLVATTTSVYVRQNSAQVWWSPAYYVSSGGDVRILNNKASLTFGAFDMTGYEYRIVYVVD